jgi:hypothetical protein
MHQRNRQPVFLTEAGFEKGFFSVYQATIAL